MLQLETIMYIKWRRFTPACLKVIHPAGKWDGWGKAWRIQLLDFSVIRNCSHQFLQAFLKLKTVVSTVCLWRRQKNDFSVKEEKPFIAVLGYLHSRSVLYPQTLKKLLLKFLLNRAVCRYRYQISDSFPSQDSTLVKYERWPGLNNPVSNSIGQQKVSSP